MVVYTCKCLNVQIYGEKSSEQLDEESAKHCPLGSKGVVVELIDPGFNFTHKCLVHRQRNEPWTVYICVPCRMQTHAVNVKANLLVLNSELVEGEDAMKEMQSRPEYSKIFKILLNGQDSSEGDDDVQLQSHEALQKQLGELQAVVTSVLKEEEAAMERRIRRFEQEQRHALDKLTDRAKLEKTSLISILFHNSERSRVPGAQGKTQAKSHAILSHSKSADDHRRQAAVPQNFPHMGGRDSRRMRDSSPDMFAMEEFEMEDPVANDEDSGLGFADRSDRRGRFDRDPSPDQFGRNRSSRLGAAPPDEDIDESDDIPSMSTSVPISMPTKHFRNLRTHPNVEEDIEETAEFADIPRHMQQLSESIQERDRYIFGDRPRTRVNTGDFTQVKWNM